MEKRTVELDFEFDYFFVQRKATQRHQKQTCRGRDTGLVDKGERMITGASNVKLNVNIKEKRSNYQELVLETRERLNEYSYCNCNDYMYISIEIYAHFRDEIKMTYDVFTG